jgi:hypothetical protein
MNPKKLFSQKKKIILIGVFLLIAVGGFFFYQRIAQDSFLSNNKHISFPAQVIKSNATRFFIDVGSTEIDSITARIKYKNPSSVPSEIKLGVRGSEKNKYFYKILYQKLLQNCNWGSISEAGTILYQKNKNYDSISDLINNLPEENKIAIYKSDWQTSLLKSTKQTSVSSIKKEIDLRGTHTFVIKVDKLPFVFKLSKQDYNARAGEDKYVISISKDGQIIEEKTIEDDGFTGKERLKKDPQSVEFKIDKINLGVYEVLAKFEGEGSDSIITSFETNQSKMVIKKTIYLWEDEPIVLYANNFPLALKIPSKNYLQTVKLDNNVDLLVEKENEKYTFDLASLSSGNNLHKLEIPLPYIYFASSGYFAFSPEEYFDPEIPLYGVDLNMVSSLDEIDYLLTSVPKARQEGDWLVNEITFDGKDIKIDENKKLYFSLEVPDLQKDGGQLEIESFDIDVKIPGILRKSSNKPTPTSKISSPVATNVPTVQPTPLLTPKPSPASKDIKIRVLNAGALSGSAQKYADLIKAAGYLNVEVGNIEGDKIKDATIVYPKTSEADVSKIEAILKNEYKNVKKITNNESTEIIINIGSLLTEVTPTVTPTVTP